MAHKTNNPIQSLGEQPFEQMLRQHLQRGGATEQPCNGFDAETANAYLERALLASAQQAYETHLADCGSCRQHVIALARLNAELTPAPVIASPQSITESFWTRWTAQASAWWNELSNNALGNALGNWGLAGAGATACVLIAALAFYGSQTTKNAQPILTAVSDESATDRVAPQPNPATVAGYAETNSELNAATPATTLPMNAPLLARENVVAKSEVVMANRGTVAQPVGTPSLPELSPLALTAAAAPAPPPMRVIDTPRGDLAFISERPSAPAIALPNNNDFFGNASRQGGVLTVGLNQGNGIRSYRLDSFEPSTPVGSLNRVKDQLEKRSTLAEIAPEEVRRERESKEFKADKSEPGRVRALIDTVLSQGRSFSFTSKQKTEALTKEADKTAESPVAKPMTKQVNGHTLYFERGIWIDEKYKANQTLPLIKLTRGSQRYQQVLIDNPMLEEFFQLAPVIVVWQGKIYEVRKGQ